MQKNILAWVIAIIVVAGLAFYGGLAYGKNQSSGANRMVLNGGQGSQRQGGRIGGNFGGATAGQVLAKDNRSLTIALSNSAGSKIVFFSPTTEVLKSVNGTIDDVAIGSPVIVTGAANPDGSVNAQTIQIRPASQRFGGTANATSSQSQ